MVREESCIVYIIYNNPIAECIAYITYSICICSYYIHQERARCSVGIENCCGARRRRRGARNIAQYNIILEEKNMTVMETSQSLTRYYEL
jgi:hypothetical protein